MHLSVLLLWVWVAGVECASAAQPVESAGQDWLVRQIDATFQQASKRRLESSVHQLSAMDALALELEQSLGMPSTPAYDGSWCGFMMPLQTDPLKLALSTGQYYHFYFPQEQAEDYRPLEQLQDYYQGPVPYPRPGRLIGYAVAADTAPAVWPRTQRFEASQRGSHPRPPSEYFDMKW